MVLPILAAILAGLGSMGAAGAGAGSALGSGTALGSMGVSGASGTLATASPYLQMVDKMGGQVSANNQAARNSQIPGMMPARNRFM